MNENTPTLNLTSTNNLTLNPGQQWGNYVVLEEISRGGMGIVYKGKEKTSGRIVAIKIMLGTKSKLSQKRFLREVEIVARLQHKNIVQVYNAGEVDKNLYMIMEYVEGITLEQLLAQKHTTIPLKNILAIVLQIAKALEFIHQNKIIHRDIKPANIIILKDGTAKIMDFGIAKNDEIKDALTKSGEVMGTPRYVAPEQLSGRRKDNTCQIDIYALGTVMYEMISRQTMIPGQTTMEVFYNIQNHTPIPLSQYISKKNKPLEIICKKATVKSRENRYLSMGLFVKDLEKFLQGEKITSRVGWSNAMKYIVSLLIFLFVVGVIVFVSKSSNNTEYENDFSPFIKGVVAFQEGKYEESHKIFRSIKNSKKYVMHSYYLAASIYEVENKKISFDQEKMNNAVLLLENNKNKLGNTDIMFYLAKCYFLLSEPRKAEQYLKKCIELEPNEEAYYTLLGQIYFDEQNYETAAENLTKSIFLKTENVKVYELLLEVSYRLPHLQLEILNTLQYIASTLNSIHFPILLQRNFEQIRRKTHSEYIEFLITRNNDIISHYHLHILATSYLQGKKIPRNILLSGKEALKQAVENTELNVFERYLIAKALFSIQELSVLQEIPSRNIITNSITTAVLAIEGYMPLHLNSTPIEKKLEAINTGLLEQEEKDFLQILVAQSICPFDYENNLVTIQNRNILENLLQSKNTSTTVKLAAAGSLLHTLAKENDEDLAYKYLMGMIQDENPEFRGYAYYHLLSANQITTYSKCVKLYQEGLSDTDNYINKTCLYFLPKYVKTTQQSMGLPINLPLYYIKNAKLLGDIQKELLFLYESKSKFFEISIKVSCLWAFSSPPIEKFLEKIEFENSIILRSLMIRSYVQAKITKLEMVALQRITLQQVLMALQKGQIPNVSFFTVPDDVKQLIDYIYLKEESVAVQAGLSFGIQTLIDMEEFIKENPKVKINEMDENVQASILNAGMSIHYGLENTIERLKKNINHPNKKIRLAALTTLPSIMREENNLKSILEDKDKENYLIWRNIGHGLYRLLNTIHIWRQVEKQNFEHLFKVYNSYQLSKTYDIYEKKLSTFSLKTKESLYLIDWSIRFIEKSSEKNRGERKEASEAVSKFYYERSLLQIAKKNLKSAEEDIIKALDLYPGNVRYYITLAEIQQIQKNIVETKKILQKINEQVQTPSLIERTAILYLELNQYEESRKLWQQLFEDDPFNKKYLLYIIRTYCLENNKEKAVFYVPWLQEICNRKYNNTHVFYDKLSQKDFDLVDFNLIQNETILRNLPE